MATMMKMPQRELHDYISEISERADIRVGSPLPLGTEDRGGGVNFAIFGRNASRVRLELFDHPEDAAPTRVIDLDSARRAAKPTKIGSRRNGKSSWRRYNDK
jgi:glycogen operon protein